MKGGMALRECSGGGPHQDGQQSLPGKLVTELRTSKQEGLKGEEGTGSIEAEGLPGQGQKSEVASRAAWCPPHARKTWLNSQCLLLANCFSTWARFT